MADGEDEPHGVEEMDDLAQQDSDMALMAGVLEEDDKKVKARTVQLHAIVRRGLDWCWANQDGGPKLLGKILKIEKDDGWVLVRWYAGGENAYRAGYDDKYDLVLATEREKKCAWSSALLKIQEGRDLEVEDLICDFGFAVGLQHAHFARFDVRKEVCKAVGGFTHGQVVVPQGFCGGVAIGVKPDNGVLKLWFHILGLDGAGLYPDDMIQQLRLEGSRVVLEANRQNFRHAELHDVNNKLMVQPLKCTFNYPTTGLNPFDPLQVYYQQYDIRDNVCEAIGGFLHGDVVGVLGQDEKFVVVGVSPRPEGGRAIWFHQFDHPGAAMLTHWPALRCQFYKIGRCQLPQYGDDNQLLTETVSAALVSTETVSAALVSTETVSAGDYLKLRQMVTGDYMDIHVDFKDITPYRLARIISKMHDSKGEVKLYNKEGTELTGHQTDRRLLSHLDVVSGDVISYVWISKTLVNAETAEVGNIVQRAPDWAFGDQDGGDEHLGKITIVDKDQQTVNVQWSIGAVASYRAGYECKYDLALATDQNKDSCDALKAIESGDPVQSRHLQCTFAYSLKESAIIENERNVPGWPDFTTSSINYFDVRDLVCKAVGGYMHSQLLAEKLSMHRRHETIEIVVIGVKADDAGRPRLWFHRDGERGAELLEDSVLNTIEVVGTRNPVQMYANCHVMNRFPRVLRVEPLPQVPEEYTEPGPAQEPPLEDEAAPADGRLVSDQSGYEHLDTCRDDSEKLSLRRPAITEHYDKEKHIYHFEWNVEEGILDSTNREKVSPAFGLHGGRDFKLILTPAITSDRRRGASFKSCKGRGAVLLKCTSNPCLTFMISVGKCDPRGPVTWNFGERSVACLPEGQEEWLFSKDIDHERKHFTVFLAIIRPICQELCTFGDGCQKQCTYGAHHTGYCYCEDHAPPPVPM